jgi:Fur family transcriptional regulator, ferric uptake regulator
MKEELEAFEAFLRSKNLRMTPQRRIIAETLFSTHQHIDAETLCNMVRGLSRNVSRATVYRTLSLLLESKLLDGRDYGHGYKQYEHVIGHIHHDHLICTGSGKVIEFTNDKVKQIVDEILEEYGYAPDTYSLVIHGISPEHQQSESEHDAPAPDAPAPTSVHEESEIPQTPDS